MDRNVHTISVELSIVGTPFPEEDTPVTCQAWGKLYLKCRNGTVTRPVVVAQAEFVPPTVHRLPIDFDIDRLPHSVVPHDQTALVRSPNFMLSQHRLRYWISAQTTSIYVGIGHLQICNCY